MLPFGRTQRYTLEVPLATKYPHTSKISSDALTTTGEYEPFCRYSIEVRPRIDPSA